MEYEDFTIKLTPLTGEGVRVRAQVFEAPLADRPRVEFELPRATENVGQRQLGKDLYRRLFQPRIAELWAASLAHVENRGKGLRLRLGFDLDEVGVERIAALPWELLCETRGGEPMGIVRQHPVVRQIFAGHPADTLETRLPLRILLAAAQPPIVGDELDMELESEMDEIEKALAQLGSSKVEVIRLPATTTTSLRQELLAGGIHVVHLMGHGGYSAEDWLGWVTLLDEEGHGESVLGEQLAMIVKGFPSLRLVVLNACLTARHGARRANAYQGVASAILERTGIPAVVAHQRPIGNDAAGRMSEILYRRLADDDPLDAAISEVRLELWRDDPDWSAPVLFLNSPDGRLVSFSDEASSTDRPASSAPTPTPLRLGIRSMIGYGDDMEDDVDELLDLREHFDPESKDGRMILDPALWHERVLPKVREFLWPHRQERRPLLLDFAAHASIAFAAGWVLEAKTGLEIGICQRTQGRSLEWRPEDGRLPSPEAPLWQPVVNIERDAAAADRALSVAVSNPLVVHDVMMFLDRERMPVSRILDARVPKPGQRSVEGGDHALLLAQALVPRVREKRPDERSGALHLFLSAPNAFTFYLGQLSRSFGRVVLYEHPHGYPDSSGRYQPSIELPPPGEWVLPAGW